MQAELGLRCLQCLKDTFLLGAFHIVYLPFLIYAHTVQGPVVQRVISLTSLLVVKMLTVLVNTIFNSLVFLLKKCEKLLQMQKLLTFFQQKY